MPSSGMLRRVDLVRTDISEELSASIIRETRIGEVGTTLAVTSNRGPVGSDARCQGTAAAIALKTKACRLVHFPGPMSAVCS
jgi:hypothetical protein